MAAGDGNGSERRPLGVHRNVIALGFVSLFTDVSTEIVRPILPVFLTSIGASKVAIGLVEGVAESLSSFWKVVSGWLADRFRRRKLLTGLGYGISAAVKPFFGLITHWGQGLAIQVVDRTGKGLRTAPRDAMIADVSEDGTRGRSFGIHRAMDQTGAVLGPLVAAVLLRAFGGSSATGAGGAAAMLPAMRKTLFCAGIPGAIAVAVLVFAVREKRRREETKKGTNLSWRGLPGGFRGFVLVMALFTLGNSSNAFLLLRAGDFGMPLLYNAFLLSLFNVVTVLFSVPGGMLSDRLGHKRVLSLAFGVYAASYVGFALATRAWMIWALFAFYGLFEALSGPAERALVGDLVPSELRGRAYGVYHFAVGVMALPASVLFGFLWERLGAPAAFGVGAALAVLAAGLLLVTVRAETSR
ncbi:MAG: MFS transporter [Planctomycetota bacterium]